jgi:hydroxymethylpyrimidine pyrophosphatase-like HAD family hydrolase
MLTLFQKKIMRLGMTSSPALAIGDGGNDVPMIQVQRGGGVQKRGSLTRSLKTHL